MDFSRISYKSFFGKLLRLPLRLIPKGMVLPILQGKLKGRKWVVGAGEHGYWLGSYEIHKRMAFEDRITPGAVVFDIGANVGFYSLLAGELVGDSGHVYAFEPSPRNVGFIRKHIRLNHFDHITVFEAAVSDHTGEAFFDLGASIATGHLADQGALRVDLVCLDDLLAQGKLRPPDFMKVDVEGAEYDVLCGAQQLLADCRPILFLDTHGRDAHAPTIALLQEIGYAFEILDGKSLPETKELVAFPVEKSN